MPKKTRKPRRAKTEGRPLREINEDELAEILAQHRKWLDSEEKEGEKADLSRANLRDANLQDANIQFANLQDANLHGVNLQQADLLNANLQEADLLNANLQEANLPEANLQRAVLRGANLQGAGLSSANLQEADLLNANLQEASLGFANLQWATLIEANLQEADLPAFFPDGRPADKKVYPWLLNGLVRFHFKLLRDECLPRLALLKRLIPSLLAWWAVPVTLLVFLVQQPIADRWGWGWQFVLAFGSLGLAGYFQHLARRTLRQEDAALKLWPRFHRLKNLGWLKKLSWPETLNWFKKLIGKRRPPAAG